MDTFSYKIPDSLDIVPNPELIGHTLTHANGKDYVVTGYVWLGADDVWGFKHTSPEGVECVRPISHILGKRGNGDQRYLISERARGIVEKMLSR